MSLEELKVVTPLWRTAATFSITLPTPAKSATASPDQASDNCNNHLLVKIEQKCQTKKDPPDSCNVYLRPEKRCQPISQ